MNGLTVSLIGELGRERPLRVISASSAMRFRRTLLSPAAIADSLGVQYVLESTIDRHRGRIQISSQLSRARPEATIWSHTYGATDQDMPALLRDVARGVVRALALPQGPGLDAPRPRRVNASSYDAYLMGLGDAGAFDLERAVPHFERAISLDSTLAPALAALANAYSQQLYFDRLPLEEGARKTDAVARRALALDETLVGAHVALGSVLALNGDGSEADRELRRAVELDPSDSDARRVYAWYLCLAGRFDAAVAQVREANSLDPLWWGALEPTGETLVCARR